MNALPLDASEMKPMKQPVSGPRCFIGDHRFWRSVRKFNTTPTLAPCTDYWIQASRFENFRSAPLHIAVPTTARWALRLQELPNVFMRFYPNQIANEMLRTGTLWKHFIQLALKRW